MKTTQQKVEKIVEEFDKLWETQSPYAGFDNEQFKSFLRTTITTALQQTREEERERIVKLVEGMIEKRTIMDEECRFCGKKFCNEDDNVCIERKIYNQTLFEVIKVIQN